MTTVAAIADFLEQFAPARLAADWDNVGLLLGDAAAPVERLMTCLTVTPDSAAEAVAEGAQLIVTHHPILFRPIQRLTSATPEGRMLLSLAKAGVAVYSPHTAFDDTCEGINDAIARRLALVDVVPLRKSEGPRQSKIVVFVPDNDLAKVSDALFRAGAGQIGQYSECSFRLAGTGTFFGSDATNPTVGQKGRREEVSEWRLEAICPDNLVEQAIAAMRRAHSYEEPAYDVYPLRPAAGAGRGRRGKLDPALSLAQLAERVKRALNVARIQLVGDPNQRIQRVALACGAAGEFLHDAFKAKADAFLTGEMRFHDYLAAQAQGISLVLPGHYATERFAIEELAERLQKRWPDVHCWPSRREADPVNWC